jgi:hypothetical protein
VNIWVITLTDLPTNDWVFTYPVDWQLTLHFVNVLLLSNSRNSQIVSF